MFYNVYLACYQKTQAELWREDQRAYVYHSSIIMRTKKMYETYYEDIIEASTWLWSHLHQESDPRLVQCKVQSSSLTSTMKNHPN